MKLLSMVTFGSEEIKPGQISARTPDIIAARRKACTSLIHICHDMPKELLVCNERILQYNTCVCIMYVLAFGGMHLADSHPSRYAQSM